MIGEIKVVEGNRKRFVEYCHYFISEIDKRYFINSKF